MRTKFKRKKIKGGEIEKQMQFYSLLSFFFKIVIKRIGMRFERFKNKRGVKLKNICNFILYSKYKKKNSNQKDNKDQL